MGFNGVLSVPLGCHPLKICNAVVGLYSVFVIHILATWNFWQKGLGNNSMHKGCFYLSVLRKVYGQITVSFLVLLK